MLEDYVVTIRLPINETPGTPGAILGADFGLNVEEDSGAVWYSDGQDIWLPAPASQSTVYAMFRGQLRFVASGSLSLDPPTGTDTPPSSEEPLSLLPAIGDCLVLDIWPQDILKLSELLPDRLLVPTRIVYQNIDQESAVQAASEIVRTHVAHYKKLFLNPEDNESEITDDVIVRRANNWLAREWIAGSTVGVYVNPKDGPVAIGEVATTPRTAPDGLPEYARVDHAPAPAEGFRRLTLKALNENDQLLHPAFLFYLLARTADDALATMWTPDSAFVSAQNGAVADLPVNQVVLQRDEGETEPIDPPPVLPMLSLQIKRDSIPVWINGLYDPFEQPDEGRWRFQSKLPPGEYEDTFHGPLLYAAQQKQRADHIPGGPAQTEIHTLSIEDIVGFDARCLQTAAAAVTEEQILDLLRGPRLADGTRATSEGLYFQYNIPDSVGTSRTDSWRSWVEHRSGTGVGGGWYLPRSSGANWLDFYRFSPGGNNLLVWNLIQQLSEDGNAALILDQYQRASNQHALARPLVRPPEPCVELSLALVAAYRQFGNRIFSNSEHEINSFTLGGLDNIGEGLRGASRGHGTLPFMRNRRYIRQEIYNRLHPELSFNYVNENTDDEEDPNSGQPVIPAMIRENEIFEIYTAVLNWWRDSVYSKLRDHRVYPADFDDRARRIWARAAISTPGYVGQAILSRPWRRSASRRDPGTPAGDANNVLGNQELLERFLVQTRHGPRHTHVFRKGHVSAAEAEILETLVFREARECMARRRPPPPTP